MEIRAALQRQAAIEPAEVDAPGARKKKARTKLVTPGSGRRRTEVVDPAMFAQAAKAASIASEDTGQVQVAPPPPPEPAQIAPPPPPEQLLPVPASMAVDEERGGLIPVGPLPEPEPRAPGYLHEGGGFLPGKETLIGLEPASDLLADDWTADDSGQPAAAEDALKPASDDTADLPSIQEAGVGEEPGEEPEIDEDYMPTITIDMPPHDDAEPAALEPEPAAAVVELPGEELVDDGRYDWAVEPPSDRTQDDTAEEISLDDQLLGSLLTPPADRTDALPSLDLDSDELDPDDFVVAETPPPGGAYSEPPLSVDEEESEDDLALGAPVAEDTHEGQEDDILTYVDITAIPGSEEDEQTRRRSEAYNRYLHDQQEWRARAANLAREGREEEIGPPPRFAFTPDEPLHIALQEPVHARPPKYPTWHALVNAWKPEHGSRYIFDADRRTVCRVIGPSDLETLSDDGSMDVVPLGGGAPYSMPVQRVMEFRHDAVFMPDRTREDAMQEMGGLSDLQRELAATVRFIALERRVPEEVATIRDTMVGTDLEKIQREYAQYDDRVTGAYCTPFFAEKLRPLLGSVEAGVRAASSLSQLRDMPALERVVGSHTQFHAALGKAQETQRWIEEYMRDGRHLTAGVYRGLREKFNAASAELIQVSASFAPVDARSATRGRPELQQYIDGYLSAVRSMLLAVREVSSSGFDLDSADFHARVQFELSSSIAHFMRSFGTVRPISIEAAEQRAAANNRVELQPADDTITGAFEVVAAVDPGVKDEFDPVEGAEYTRRDGARLVVTAEVQGGFVRAEVTAPAAAAAQVYVDSPAGMRRFLLEHHFDRAR